MDYFESEELAAAWFGYVRPMLAICHVAITSSALLLTAATFERFLTISKIRSQFSTGFRLLITLIVFFFAITAKAPFYFEMDVSTRNYLLDCPFLLLILFMFRLFQTVIVLGLLRHNYN